MDAQFLCIVVFSTIIDLHSFSSLHSLYAPFFVGVFAGIPFNFQLHDTMQCTRISSALAATRVLLDNNQFQQISDLLSRTHRPNPQTSKGDLFNGNFQSDQFFDTSVLSNMQQTLQASLTPEMRDSMASMMHSALQRGDGMPGGQMGMMAFGMGENEKGKKVARGATLSYDLKTGKVNKDFMEQQLEDDDPCLPKETVGDYSTEGAMEVEFVEDQRQLHGAEHTETVLPEDIEVESSDDTRR
ncbi:hypothetical protein STCU_01395 [Strigomonas culicis]|uniref:Uncharacterized protein n=1 Tax=Strigomonas culicis TaxID=28005 RepID=S9UUV7_9TRYP|nr:hypothetical protein STCU_01395 [Strigomonas culicis]|eukprot:EPY34707.1 hypothetical protein STCU_01395 [Strigomonas culicis]